MISNNQYEFNSIRFDYIYLHCIVYLHRSTDPHYYIGYVGKYELKDLTDGIKVEFHLIVYHQNYSVTSKENDIGMVKVFTIKSCRILITRSRLGCKRVACKTGYSRATNTVIS